MKLEDKKMSPEGSPHIHHPPGHTETSWKNHLEAGSTDQTVNADTQESPKKGATAFFRDEERNEIKKIESIFKYFTGEEAPKSENASTITDIHGNETPRKDKRGRETTRKIREASDGNLRIRTKSEYVTMGESDPDNRSSQPKRKSTNRVEFYLEDSVNETSKRNVPDVLIIERANPDYKPWKKNDPPRYIQSLQITNPQKGIRTLIEIKKRIKDKETVEDPNKTIQIEIIERLVNETVEKMIRNPEQYRTEIQRQRRENIYDQELLEQIQELYPDLEDEIENIQENLPNDDEEPKKKMDARQKRREAIGRIAHSEREIEKIEQQIETEKTKKQNEQILIDLAVEQIRRELNGEDSSQTEEALIKKAQRELASMLEPRPEQYLPALTAEKRENLEKNESRKTKLEDEIAKLKEDLESNISSTAKDVIRNQTLPQAEKELKEITEQITETELQAKESYFESIGLKGLKLTPEQQKTLTATKTKISELQTELQSAEEGLEEIEELPDDTEEEKERKAQAKKEQKEEIERLEDEIAQGEQKKNDIKEERIGKFIETAISPKEEKIRNENSEQIERLEGYAEAIVNLEAEISELQNRNHDTPDRKAELSSKRKELKAYKSLLGNGLKNIKTSLETELAKKLSSESYLTNLNIQKREAESQLEKAWKDKRVAEREILFDRGHVEGEDASDMAKDAEEMQKESEEKPIGQKLAEMEAKAQERIESHENSPALPIIEKISNNKEKLLETIKKLAEEQINDEDKREQILETIETLLDSLEEKDNITDEMLTVIEENLNNESAPYIEDQDKVTELLRELCSDPNNSIRIKEDTTPKQLEEMILNHYAEQILNLIQDEGLTEDEKIAEVLHNLASMEAIYDFEESKLIDIKETVNHEQVKRVLDMILSQKDNLLELISDHIDSLKNDEEEYLFEDSEETKKIFSELIERIEKGNLPEELKTYLKTQLDAEDKIYDEDPSVIKGNILQILEDKGIEVTSQTTPDQLREILKEHYLNEIANEQKDPENTTANGILNQVASLAAVLNLEDSLLKELIPDPETEKATAKITKVFTHNKGFWQKAGNFLGKAVGSAGKALAGKVIFGALASNPAGQVVLGGILIGSAGLTVWSAFKMMRENEYTVNDIFTKEFWGGVGKSGLFSAAKFGVGAILPGGAIGSVLTGMGIGILETGIDRIAKKDTLALSQKQAELLELKLEKLQEQDYTIEKLEEQGILTKAEKTSEIDQIQLDLEALLEKAQGQLNPRNNDRDNARETLLKTLQKISPEDKLELSSGKTRKIKKLNIENLDYEDYNLIKETIEENLDKISKTEQLEILAEIYFENEMRDIVQELKETKPQLFEDIRNIVSYNVGSKFASGLITGLMGITSLGKGVKEGGWNDIKNGIKDFFDGQTSTQPEKITSLGAKHNIEADHLDTTPDNDITAEIVSDGENNYIAVDTDLEPSDKNLGHEFLVQITQEDLNTAGVENATDLPADQISNILDSQEIGDLIPIDAEAAVEILQLQEASSSNEIPALQFEDTSDIELPEEKGNILGVIRDGNNNIEGVVIQGEEGGYKAIPKDSDAFDLAEFLGFDKNDKVTDIKLEDGDKPSLEFTVEDDEEVEQQVFVRKGEASRIPSEASEEESIEVNETGSNGADEGDDTPEENEAETKLPEPENNWMETGKSIEDMETEVDTTETEVDDTLIEWAKEIDEEGNNDGFISWLLDKDADHGKVQNQIDEKIRELITDEKYNPTTSYETDHTLTMLETLKRLANNEDFDFKNPDADVIDETTTEAIEFLKDEINTSVDTARILGRGKPLASPVQQQGPQDIDLSVPTTPTRPNYHTYQPPSDTVPETDSVTTELTDLAKQAGITIGAGFATAIGNLAQILTPNVKEETTIEISQPQGTPSPETTHETAEDFIPENLDQYAEKLPQQLQLSTLLIDLELALDDDKKYYIATKDGKTEKAAKKALIEELKNIIPQSRLEDILEAESLEEDKKFEVKIPVAEIKKLQREITQAYLLIKKHASNSNIEHNGAIEVLLRQNNSEPGQRFQKAAVHNILALGGDPDRPKPYLLKNFEAEVEKLKEQENSLDEDSSLEDVRDFYKDKAELVLKNYSSDPDDPSSSNPPEAAFYYLACYSAIEYKIAEGQADVEENPETETSETPPAYQIFDQLWEAAQQDNSDVKVDEDKKEIIAKSKHEIRNFAHSYIPDNLLFAENTSDNPIVIGRDGEFIITKDRVESLQHEVNEAYALIEKHKDVLFKKIEEELTEENVELCKGIVNGDLEDERLLKQNLQYFISAIKFPDLESPTTINEVISRINLTNAQWDVLGQFWQMTEILENREGADPEPQPKLEWSELKETPSEYNIFNQLKQTVEGTNATISEDGNEIKFNSDENTVINNLKRVIPENILNGIIDSNADSESGEITITEETVKELQNKVDEAFDLIENHRTEIVNMIKSATENDSILSLYNAVLYGVDLPDIKENFTYQLEQLLEHVLDESHETKNRDKLVEIIKERNSRTPNHNVLRNILEMAECLEAEEIKMQNIAKKLTDTYTIVKGELSSEKVVQLPKVKIKESSEYDKKVQKVVAMIAAEDEDLALNIAGPLIKDQKTQTVIAKQFTREETQDLDYYEDNSQEKKTVHAFLRKLGKVAIFYELVPTAIEVFSTNTENNLNPQDIADLIVSLEKEFNIVDILALRLTSHIYQSEDYDNYKRKVLTAADEKNQEDLKLTFDIIENIANKIIS